MFFKVCSTGKSSPHVQAAHLAGWSATDIYSSSHWGLPAMPTMMAYGMRSCGRISDPRTTHISVSAGHGRTAVLKAVRCGREMRKGWRRAQTISLETDKLWVNTRWWYLSDPVAIQLTRRNSAKFAHPEPSTVDIESPIPMFANREAASSRLTNYCRVMTMLDDHQNSKKGKTSETMRQTPDWLVGGWPTPLKNMKVSWDYYSQYMEK